MATKQNAWVRLPKTRLSVKFPSIEGRKYSLVIGKFLLADMKQN